MTLSISGNQAGGVTVSAVTLSGIEKISASNYDLHANVTTIDLANATGVATLALAGSSATGDMAFTSVQAIVAAEMSNGAGDLSITYADAAVAGTADTQNLTLSGVTSGSTFTVAGTSTGGVETLAITSSGSARNVASVADQTTLTKVTVAGSQALTLGTVGASVTTLDASSNTGGLTATLNNVVATVTGAEGNDVITAGSALTTGTVNAGGGTADTLVLTAEGVIGDATEGAKFTNFETVKLSATAAAPADRTFDNSFMTGITGYGVTIVDDTDDNSDESVSVSFSKLANTGSTLAITGLSTAEDGHDLTVALSAGVLADGSADSIALTMGTATAGSGTNTVAAGNNGGVELDLTLDNFETLSIASQGGANFIKSLADSSLKSLTVTGDKALTIAAITGATALATINASAATAAVIISANASTTASTITGGTGADTFVGSTKADSIDGGAGNDNLTGGDGNDTIIGGAGDDQITGAVGTDSLSGGDGNDTFTVATASHFQGLTAAETIDGGAGNDTLDFTANMTLVAADLTTVSSIETFKFSSTGANSITLADANFGTGASMTITDGDLTQGALTVIGSALTAGHDLTITGNTSTGVNDSLVGGAGNDTFKFSGTAALESTDVVTGGAGTADTISLAATAAVTIDMTGVTTVERVVTTGTGTADADDVTIVVGADTVLAASSTLTIDTSSQTNGAPDTSIDATALTTVTKNVNVTTGAGVDTVLGGSGNDVISTGAGADGITGGAGIDNLSGGAGNDVFTVGTAAHFIGLAAVETVAGGDGTDTLSFATGLAPVLNASDLLGMTSIEKITTLNTATAFSVTLTDAVYTANGNTSLIIDATAMTTGDLTVAASGLTAANSVTVEREDAGANTGDNIVLGAGNDTVKIDVASLDNAMTLTGGTGTDTLTITDAGTIGSTTLVAAITGFETVNFGEDDDFTLVTVDANVAAAATMTVTGAALIGANALSFNGSAELDGFFALTGGAAGDTLIGGALADTIIGGAGADVITGGKGADSLTGGTGADTFVYTSTSVIASSGSTIDTITDFTTTSDKIQVTLDYSAFAAAVDVNTNLVSTAGDLSAKRGEFVYDSTTSQLQVNVNNDNLFTTQDFKIGVATVVAADVNFAVVGSVFGDTLVGGAGADSITATGGNDSITGGAGDDTITLTTTGNTVNAIVFGASATANGADTIVGFEAGTSATDGEILDFRAFVTGQLMDAGGAANTGTTAVTEYTTAASGAEAVNNKIVVFANGGTALTATTLAAEFATGESFGEAASMKTVVIEGNANGGVGGFIWYVSDTSGDGDIQVGEVVLVGTLSTNVDIDALVGNQFL